MCELYLFDRSQAQIEPTFIGICPFGAVMTPHVIMFHSRFITQTKHCAAAAAAAASSKYVCRVFSPRQSDEERWQPRRSVDLSEHSRTSLAHQ